LGHVGCPYLPTVSKRSSCNFGAQVLFGILTLEVAQSGIA